jgi:hypothetical protein
MLRVVCVSIVIVVVVDGNGVGRIDTVSRVNELLWLLLMLLIELWMV